MDAALSMIATERQAAGVQSAAVARLTQLNLDDLIASFGWQDRPLLAGLSRRVLRRPAQAFARQIADFDMAVGSEGLIGAARGALAHYVREVRVYGREHIPTGPFLALANHPGLSDALSLFTALDRNDLRVIALQRPFLQALPHTSQRLSCLCETAPSSPAAVREVAAHLGAGGAALSFPAGRIEPDPGAGPGSVRSLESWARSADLFARLTPEAAVLPVLVRGVVWSRVARNWLVRFRSTATDREKTAAALQLLANVVLKVKPVSVSVQIGRPILARDLDRTSARGMHRAVLAEMAGLIRNPPDGHGQRVA